MPYILIIEFLAAAAGVLIVAAFWRQRKANIQQERLTAAFERSQASRVYGCGQPGNALIQQDM